MVKGSGGNKPKDPCQKEACAIQECLQKNNYQEQRCQSVIQALYECCGRYLPGVSAVCDGMYKDKKGKNACHTKT